MSLGVALAIAVPLFLTFMGTIFALGKMKQTIDDLVTKVGDLSGMRDKMDDISTRLTVLETTIGRRATDAYWHEGQDG